MATTVSCAFFLSGCSPTYGFTNTRAGNDLRSEFCDSVRTFVRAPLDEEGLRRAWFLPPGFYEDGSFDFYAPMSSEPPDDAASEFYNKRAGQLTHYTTAPQFAFELSKCLSPGAGFARVRRDLDDAAFSGSYVDNLENRVIEVRAQNQTTSILVADSDWTGDILDAMVFDCSSRCEVE